MRHITFQDDVFQEENGSRLQIFQANHYYKNTKYSVFGKNGKALILLFYHSMIYFSGNEYLAIIWDTMITTLYFLNVHKELNQIISVCSIPTVL